MGRQYVRNHTVPTSVLGYWVCDSLPYPAVHVYDVRRRHKYVSNARGKKPFSFAIRKEVYVTDVDGERATGVERWLSKLEGSLAAFIAQLHARGDLVISAEDLDKAVMALAAMEARSPYNLNLVRDYIERHPEVRARISGNPERDTARLTLENMVHYVNEWAGRLWRPELTVVYSEDEPFVIGDRPYFNFDEAMEERFFVLTPNTFLGIRRSPEGIRGAVPYQCLPAKQGFVEWVNRMIVQHAREWIVATSEGQLDSLTPIFDTEEWRTQLEGAEPRLERPRALTSGWSLRPD